MDLYEFMVKNFHITELTVLVLRQVNLAIVLVWVLTV